MSRHAQMHRVEINMHRSVGAEGSLLDFESRPGLGEVLGGASRDHVCRTGRRWAEVMLDTDWGSAGDSQVGGCKGL